MKVYTIQKQDGTVEKVVKRVKIPGKCRGFLSYCASGNCYQSIRHVATFVCNASQYPDLDPTDRSSLLQMYAKAQLERDGRMLAEYIASRWPHYRYDGAKEEV